MSLSQLLVNKPPLWTGAMACYPYNDRMVKQFTAKTAFGDEYVMYRYLGDKMLVPRAVCPVGAEDLRVSGVPYRFPNLAFAPRDEKQANAVIEAMKLLLEGKSFILEAGTGTGKTVMACPLIAAVGKMALIVVTKSDLLGRWRDELKKTLGLADSEIGLVRGDIASMSGKKVVVAMVQTLARDVNRLPSWAKNEVGFVIFDEVHRLGAEEFGHVASMFPAKLRMGLSARSKRRDGREDYFQAHIGPVMVKLEGVNMIPQILIVETGWKCPRKQDGTKIPHGAGRDTHVKKILAANAMRNNTIVKAIGQCYRSGRKIVIFSEFTDHLKLLAEACTSMGVVEHFDVGMYFGTMTRAQEDAAKLARVIFATYGKMGEATDIPALDTAIMGTPRSDVMQIVGRILRIFEGKKTPSVIDFVDNDSPVFKAYARGRRAWYESIKAPMVSMGVTM